MTLLELCTDLLDAVVDIVDDPPDRRYIAAGPPVLDCEQITVHASGVTAVHPPGAGRAPCAVIPAATLTAVLVRCTTTAPTPPADVLDSEGTRTLTDAAAMWTGLTDRWHNGLLFDGVDCSHVDWRPGVTITAPSGGLVAVTATFTVTLT